MTGHAGLTDPLRNPIDGAFFDGPCRSNSHVLWPSGLRSGQPACVRLLDGTKLFERGDYSRNPFDRTANSPAQPEAAINSNTLSAFINPLSLL